MIIIPARKTIQPEIAEHHREEVKADEVPEAEAGAHEKKRDHGKDCRRSHGDVPSGWIEIDMKLVGFQVVRDSIIGDDHQRQAANDNVNAKQQAEPEAVALIVSHAGMQSLR